MIMLINLVQSETFFVYLWLSQKKIDSFVIIIIDMILYFQYHE